MRTLTAIVAGILAGGAILAGGGVLASPPEDSAEKAGGCAIAFVDYKRAMQALTRFKDLEEKLRGEDEQVRDAMTKRKAELRKYNDDVLARFSPGTAAFEAERRKIELTNAEIRYDEKVLQEILQKKSVVGAAGIYREVCAEAERIARERGYACVMNYDSTPLEVEDKGQVMGPAELHLQMRMRSVLWARSDVDLTQAVVDALNK